VKARKLAPFTLIVENLLDSILMKLTILKGMGKISDLRKHEFDGQYHRLRYCRVFQLGFYTCGLIEVKIGYAIQI
jgi:hypothetical protein